MKRYIRTKDGKIFDISKYLKLIEGFCEDLYDEYSAFDIVCERELGTKYLYIVKQSDTIEELIEVGDLIVYIDQNLKKDSLRQPEIAKVYLSQSGKELCCEGAWLKYFFKDLLELYTKQGRNYVLVWTKEEGVI